MLGKEDQETRRLDKQLKGQAETHPPETAEKLR